MDGKTHGFSNFSVFTLIVRFVFRRLPLEIRRTGPWPTLDPKLPMAVSFQSRFGRGGSKMIGCGSHSPAQSNKGKEEEGRRGKLAATEERKKDGEVNSPLRKRGRRTAR
jgi:hypothetical protein